MIIPEELAHRVCKTRLSGLSSGFRKLDQVRKEWPGSEIDVIYETTEPIVCVVFETAEDCLAFKLKYGDEYV